MSNVGLANWQVKTRGNLSEAEPSASAESIIPGPAARPASAFQTRFIASRGQAWQVKPEESPPSHGVALSSDEPAIEVPAPIEPQAAEPAADQSAIEAPAPVETQAAEPVLDQAAIEAPAPVEPQAAEPVAYDAAIALVDAPMPIQLDEDDPIVDGSAIAPVEASMPIEAVGPVEPQEAEPVADRSAFAPIKAPAPIEAKTADSAVDPFSYFEWPQPTEEAEDDAVPLKAFRLPGISMHVAGGLAVLATALIAPLLIEKGPDTTGTEVSSVSPPSLPVGTSLDRSGEEVAQAPPTAMPTVSLPAPAEAPGAGQDEPLPPPLPAAFPPDRRINPGYTEAARPSRPQSEPPASRASPLASGSSNAAQVIAGPSAPPVPVMALAPPPAPAPAPPVIAKNDQQIVREKPVEWTPAQLIGGELRSSDNKKGRQGSVGISLTVRADGRIGGCRVTGSSGNPSLDSTTCRLAAQRLQFKPARDSMGRPVESEVSTSYTWSRTSRK